MPPAIKSVSVAKTGEFLGALAVCSPSAPLPFEKAAKNTDYSCLSLDCLTARFRCVFSFAVLPEGQITPTTIAARNTKAARKAIMFRFRTMVICPLPITSV